MGKLSGISYLFIGSLCGLFSCSGQSSTPNQPSNNNYQAPAPLANNVKGWQSIDMIADFAETKLDALGHFDTSRNACGHEAYGTLDLQLWNQIVSMTNQAIASPPLDNDDLDCFDIPDGNRMDGTVDVILDFPTPGPVAHAVAVEVASFASPTPMPAPTPTHTRPDPFPSWMPSFPPRPGSTPSMTASNTPSPSPSPSEGPSRSLFEVRGGQICSTISNQTMAIQLLQSISQFVDIADKQDCPNGYGSD